MCNFLFKFWNLFKFCKNIKKEDLILIEELIINEQIMNCILQDKLHKRKNQKFKLIEKPNFINNRPFRSNF